MIVGGKRWLGAGNDGEESVVLFNVKAEVNESQNLSRTNGTKIVCNGDRWTHRNQNRFRFRSAPKVTSRCGKEKENTPLSSHKSIISHSPSSSLPFTLSHCLSVIYLSGGRSATPCSLPFPFILSATFLFRVPFSVSSSSLCSLTLTSVLNTPVSLLQEPEPLTPPKSLFQRSWPPKWHDSSSTGEVGPELWVVFDVVWVCDRR